MGNKTISKCPKCNIWRGVYIGRRVGGKYYCPHCYNEALAENELMDFMASVYSEIRNKYMEF